MLTRLLLTLPLLAFPLPALAQSPSELKGHDGLVHGLAFSPDGKTLASASFDKTVKLWDYPAGKELKTLAGHGDAVYSVAFSPDGKLLASGSQDKTVRLWNVADGKLAHELKGFGDTVECVAFSPDGKLLATASADKSVRLWNPEDGKEVKKLGEHKGAVYNVAFSPDGKLLASASNDASVKLWDVEGKKEKATLQVTEKKKVKEKDKEVEKDVPTTDAVLAVLFAPDGKQLYAAGFDRLVRVWNVDGGKQEKQFGPLDGDPYGLALSRDGGKLAVVTYGGHIVAWDRGSDAEVFNLDLQGYISYCLVFAPDGQAVVTGHEKEGVGLVKVTPLTK